MYDISLTVGWIIDASRHPTSKITIYSAPAMGAQIHLSLQTCDKGNHEYCCKLKSNFQIEWCLYFCIKIINYKYRDHVRKGTMRPETTPNC